MKKIKTFKIHTLGCKVNQYDSQILRQRFKGIGFSELNNGHPADVCIINTCTVTSKANSKAREIIRSAIRNNPGAEVIVTGCYAKDNPEELREIKGVSFVVENDIIDKDFTVTEFSGHTRAFVKIQDGCDNFCSYCIVPYVRGRVRSRKPKEIIKEVLGLTENGFKEIVLCGICLGKFGKDFKNDTNLISLIDQIEKISKLKRIRLSSIEAEDITDTLIHKINNSNKLCKHLHIPFQSGDDYILKCMNRNYTQRFYLNLVTKIKKKIPDLGITTDIIVGFPGENDKNFKNTVKLLEKVMPLRTHIFPFSAREGTRAYLFKDKIPPDTIKKRASFLSDVAANLSFLYRKQFLSKEVEILIEDYLDKRYNVFQGYSSNYIKVFIGKNDFEPSCINKIVKGKIININYETTWVERIK